MTKDNEDALRCAETLRQLDSAKKYHPSGVGGQMLGCESYRLIASGFSFYELQNAADHLDRLVRESEAKDALLRQAVAAMAPVSGFGRVGSRDVEQAELQRTIAAIRQHLEGRA